MLGSGATALAMISRSGVSFWSVAGLLTQGAQGDRPAPFAAPFAAPLRSPQPEDSYPFPIAFCMRSPESTYPWPPWLTGSHHPRSVAAPWFGARMFSAAGWPCIYLITKVSNKTPSWPRSWANSSPL